ncbi:unnamed protein product [Meloidogyne enterolobii]|uniref:Uncharacterized protein n=1 Tax=Meloidogyne enterolobii TaxID=390850 RepID=A0ACB0XYF9_MELEN
MFSSLLRSKKRRTTTTTTTTETYSTTPNFEDYDNNTLTNSTTTPTYGTTESVFIYQASNVEFNACNKNNNYYLNFILVVIFIIRML